MIVMRQKLKKWQFFALFNFTIVAALRLWGNIHFTAQNIISVIISLGFINFLSLISAKKFKDWKK